jgi:acyl carrier protein
MSVDDLIALIRAELRIDLDLDATTPLLSSGIVDSLGVVVLLTAVEEQYGVVIDEELVGVDTFDTPAQIIDLIETLARASRLRVG